MSEPESCEQCEEGMKRIRALFQEMIETAKAASEPADEARRHALAIVSSGAVALLLEELGDPLRVLWVVSRELARHRVGMQVEVGVDNTAPTPTDAANLSDAELLAMKDLPQS